MKIRVLKTIVAAVVALTLALLSMPISFAEGLSGPCGENLKWSFEQSTGTLTISGKGVLTNNTWDYNEEDGMFDYESVVNLVIKDGVTVIEDEVFEFCDNIANITLPDSVEYISNYTFSDTAFYNNPANWENNVLYIGKFLVEAESSLSGVYTIKDGTKMICDYAFDHCMLLTDIIIPDSVVTIGEAAFRRCEALENITISNGAKTIEAEAFAYCKSLTSITIPDSVEKIGSSAFSHCESLANVSIGDGVKEIGNQAFGGTEFSAQESNWENDVLYCGEYLLDGSPEGDYTIKDGTKVIAVCAFRSCEDLTSVTVPDSVISIGYDAFRDTGVYNDINNWENGVLYIGKFLVEAQRGLSGDYKIKEGTIGIVGYAFLSCESLTSVTIPDSVKTIGEKAFSGCSSIKNIILPNGITTIKEETFGGCKKLYSITIGNGVADIDENAFGSCFALSQVNYGGSEADWNKISIGAHNDYLMSATKNFAQNTPTGSLAAGNSSASNSSDSGSEKTSDGNGAVVVIVVVAVVVVIVAAGVTFVIIKKKKS